MKNIGRRKLNEEETVILISSNHTDPNFLPKDSGEIPPYMYGGIAVAIICALTAYSKSLIDSIHKLIKTLTKHNKNQ